MNNRIFTNYISLIEGSYCHVNLANCGGFQCELQMSSIWRAGNLSQAAQACLCKIILVWSKCLAKQSLFLSQFGRAGVQIQGVELTRVSLNYK